MKYLLLLLCFGAVAAGATEVLLITSDGNVTTKTIELAENIAAEAEADDDRQPLSKYRSLPPDEVMRQALAGLYDTLLRETISSDDTEKIDGIIKQQVMPVFDFGRFARRIMAKHFRQASKEQFFDFAVVLRQSLVDTYVRALLSTDYKSLLESSYFDIGEAKYNERNQYRAIVPVQLLIENLDPIQIDFTMYYNKGKDTWLAENIIVEGINLGLTYRNQFNELMANNGNDLDKTTKAWSRKEEQKQREAAEQAESASAAVQPADPQLEEISILPLNESAQPMVLQPTEVQPEASN